MELLDGIETLPTDKANHFLKQVIKKVHYTRDLPEELRKLSTRNPERGNYPFDYVIEYF